MNDKPKRPLVCVLAYNDLCVFEFAIGLEIFALPRPEFDQWYDCKVVATAPGPIFGMGGVTIEACSDLSVLEEASLIIVPGWSGTVSPKLKKTLRTANENGVRIATICSGVFLPAACGLLNGRRATTHWRYTEKLQKDYPQILVDPDVLYIDETSIMSSAGSAAGIDLCLHIVRKDFGSKMANTVARRLLLPAHREGGQAQFVPRPSPRQKDGFSPLLDKIRAQLNEHWSVERMAQIAAVSPRTLLRKFKQTTGESPLNWVTKERVGLAKELLETTNSNVHQIADACGFCSPELLRHHFKRYCKLSPMRYRAQFK